MNNFMPAPRSASSSPWMALIFAVGVFGIGMVPGALTFIFDPHAAERIGLEAVPVPAWLFTNVWRIIYPGRVLLRGWCGELGASETSACQ